jgi:hypothetical protein
VPCWTRRDLSRCRADSTQWQQARAVVEARSFLPPSSPGTRDEERGVKRTGAALRAGRTRRLASISVWGRDRSCRTSSVLPPPHLTSHRAAVRVRFWPAQHLLEFPSRARTKTYSALRSRLVERAVAPMGRELPPAWLRPIREGGTGQHCEEGTACPVAGKIGPDAPCVHKVGSTKAMDPFLKHRVASAQSTLDPSAKAPGSLQERGECGGSAISTWLGKRVGARNRGCPRPTRVGPRARPTRNRRSSPRA